MKALLVLLALAGTAEAYKPCAYEEGWSTANGTVLPKHPRLAYAVGIKHRYSGTVVGATIDGVVVPVHVAWSEHAGYQLVLVDIESDRTGKLELVWPEGSYKAPGTFTIVDRPLPAKVRGTLRRVDEKYFKGLEIQIDGPAVTMEMKWRRDAASAWSTIEVPVQTIDGNMVGRFGRHACNTSISKQLLDGGIELEAIVLRADGTRTKVELPARYEPTAERARP